MMLDALPTLLRLVGEDLPADVRPVGVDLTWSGLAPWAGLLLFLAAAAFSIWTYLGMDRPSRLRRTFLAGLRVAAAGLLVLLLVRPTLLILAERLGRGTFVLLVDDSSSMALVEGRAEPDDRARAALAAGRLPPGSLAGAPADLEAFAAPRPRWEVARDAFRNESLDLVGRLAARADLARYSFGGEAVAAPADFSGARAFERGLGVVGDLRFAEPRTALGTAVRQVLDDLRGRGLVGILVVTDGASNTGDPPAEAAALARADGVPLHVYGVGVDSPRDVAVLAVEAPDVVFLGDAVAVNVRHRALNLAGRTAELRLTLGSETVAREALTLGPDGAVVTSLQFTPATKGDYDLAAQIPPLSDEVERGNNRAARRLRVIDRRVRVLLVERQPRWEHRFLLSLLERDRRLEVRTVYLDPDPGLGTGATADSVYLPSFPLDRETLLNFDVVVLGDLDPADLPPAAPPLLAELVARLGGSLVFLAGPQYGPHAWAGHALEPLLPVAPPPAAPVVPEPVPPGEPTYDPAVLTPAGAAEPSLLLADDPRASAAVWADLPGFSWVAEAGAPRPAAQVLLRWSRLEPARSEGPPVLARMATGSGFTLYVGTDQLWRWRRGVGERHHTRFWVQTLLRLASARAAGEEGRRQIATDRPSYAPGDRVEITARVFRDDWTPEVAPSVAATLTLPPPSPGAPAPTRPLTLAAVPGAAGQYRAEWTATATGVLTAALAADPAARATFEVAAPRLELAEPALQLAALRELATAGAGEFLREEDLHRLPDLVQPRAELVTSPLRLELAHLPGAFVAALLLLTLEWSLRRLWRLK